MQQLELQLELQQQAQQQVLVQPAVPAVEAEPVPRAPVGGARDCALHLRGVIVDVDLGRVVRAAAYRVEGMEAMDAAQYRQALERKLIEQQMARKID